MQYFLFSFSADVINKALLATVISILCVWGIPIRIGVFVALSLLQIMLMTDSLLWWTLYFITHERNIVMLICTLYISVSFIMNLGALIESDWFLKLQWMSSIHNHVSLLFGTLLTPYKTEWIMDGFGRLPLLFTGRPIFSWAVLGILQLVTLPFLLFVKYILSSVYQWYKPLHSFYIRKIVDLPSS